MVMISACLAGKKCRYDGGAKPTAEILARIAGGEEFCLVCPECMGGKWQMPKGRILFF